MMTNHTPGPWHTKELEDGIRPIEIVSDTVEDGPFAFVIQIAKVNRHSEQTMANAHLIAASPDLLAALTMLLGRFKEVCGDDSGTDMADIERIDIVHAAINKARGT